MINFPDRAIFSMQMECSENVRQTEPTESSCCELQPEEMRLRHEWIAVAAYYKAEKRGFDPNHEWDDWFAAEIDYAKRLVDEFLAILEEDGALTLVGLRKLATSVGIANAEKFATQTDLIQAVQSACKDFPCFRTAPGSLCNQNTTCQWRFECKKLIADWFCHK